MSQFFRAITGFAPPASTTNWSNNIVRLVLSGLSIVAAVPAGQPVPPYSGSPRVIWSSSAEATKLAAIIAENTSACSSCFIISFPPLAFRVISKKLSKGVNANAGPNLKRKIFDLKKMRPQRSRARKCMTRSKMKQGVSLLIHPVHIRCDQLAPVNSHPYRDRKN